MKPIPMEQWQWFGNAGHLCVASRCRHHLCTKVGDYLVSTVGEFYARDNDAKPTTIGCDRTYETFVFEAGSPCECGCGLPGMGSDEIDTLPANDAKTANANHMAMCRKYAAIKPAKKRRAGK